MSGRTKPARRRHARPTAVNNLQIALAAATRFTPAELKHLLAPIQGALVSMRTGMATEMQWMHLASVTAIALSIERLGVVRGLKAQLDEADQLLAVIRQRATRSGAWAAPVLYGHEITAIETLVHLHTFQAQTLSAGEYRAAWQHASAEVTRVGGRHIKAIEQVAAAAC
jgi:hypothetical protein